MWLNTNLLLYLSVSMGIMIDQFSEPYSAIQTANF